MRSGADPGLQNVTVWSESFPAVSHAHGGLIFCGRAPLHPDKERRSLKSVSLDPCEDEIT